MKIKIDENTLKSIYASINDLKLNSGYLNNAINDCTKEINEMIRNNWKYTSDAIIEFNEKSKPKITFNCDKQTYKTLQKLKNSDGVYLVQQNEKGQVTLFGIPIECKFATEQFFIKVYTFADGSIHVEDFDV